MYKEIRKLKYHAIYSEWNDGAETDKFIKQRNKDRLQLSYNDWKDRERVFKNNETA